MTQAQERVNLPSIGAEEFDEENLNTSPTYDTDSSAVRETAEEGDDSYKPLWEDLSGLGLTPEAMSVRASTNSPVVVMKVDAVLPKVTTTIYAQPSFLTGPLRETVTNSGTRFQVLVREREDGCGDVLGAHGPEYKLVQNSDLFSMAEAAVREGTLLTVNSGYLRDKLSSWMSLKFQSSSNVGRYTVTPHVILHNSLDGQKSVGALRVDIAVKDDGCQVFLYKKDIFKYRHRSLEENTEEFLQKVRDEALMMECHTQYGAMSQKEITEVEMSNVVSKVLAEQRRRPLPEAMEPFMNAFSTESQTAFDALCTISKVLTYKSKVHGTDVKSSRLNSTLFGYVSRPIDAAFSLLASL